MSGSVLDNEPILVASQVTRRFGGLVAVNKVDFTIPERSIVSPHRAERRRQDHVLQRPPGRHRPDRRRAWSSSAGG